MGIQNPIHDHHAAAAADDDDIPPPLDADEPSPSTVKADDHDDDSTSLMDQMMEESGAALKKKQDRARALRNKRAKQFGNGMKKGFFCNTSSKSKSAKATQAGKEEPVMVHVKPTEKKEEAFLFPEVQAALNDSTLEKKLKSTDWITPDTIADIQKQNPKLIKALENPKFVQALTDIQTNPQGAFEKYQHDPTIQSLLMEWMQFFGQHFEQQGQKQQQQQQPAAPTQSSKEEIQAQALKGIRTKSKKEEEVLSKIIATPELQALLSDPKIHEMLQKCSANPQFFRQMMHDPNMGPKLQLLIQSGCVRIDS